MIGEVWAAGEGVGSSSDSIMSGSDVSGIIITSSRRFAIVCSPKSAGALLVFEDKGSITIDDDLVMLSPVLVRERAARGGEEGRLASFCDLVEAFCGTLGKGFDGRLAMFRSEFGALVTC